MKVSDSRLREFIALYRVEFGVDLTMGEALEAGTVIAALVNAVCRSDNSTKDKYTGHI